VGILGNGSGRKEVDNAGEMGRRSIKGGVEQMLFEMNKGSRINGVD